MNRYLSCGVDGVQLPHVGGADEARALLAGIADWEGDHTDKLVVMMLESEEGIDALPDLATMDGIDVFYLGAFDLAASMGLKGAPKHPRVQARIEEAVAAIAGAGRVAGMNLQDDIDAIAAWRGRGLRWINVHMREFMRRGARAFLAAARD